MRCGREVYVRGERWLFDPEGRHVSPQDPKHYEPCWCWSGKKFKSCHMLRHQARRPPISEIVGTWRALHPPRRCLAPDAPQACNGKVVDSHVVQRRGGGLKQIARDGQVHGFKFHPMFFVKKQGRHAPELIGIGQAGTSPLFCARHDRDLFKHAETEIFGPTPRQLFELNYRTVACRLHTNEAVLPQVGTLYTADAGLSRDEQRRHFIAVEAYRQESEVILENTRTLKRCYDEWITAPDLSLNALILRFRGAPEFMCASLVYAIMDFSGKPIQPVGGTAHICFYTVADGDAVTVAFAWVGRNAGAEQLCHSLLLLPEAVRASALVQYAVEYIDSTYFRPQWWESLDGAVQEMLIDRLTAHSTPFREHAVDALVPAAGDISALRAEGAEIIGTWHSSPVGTV